MKLKLKPRPRVIGVPVDEIEETAHYWIIRKPKPGVRAVCEIASISPGIPPCKREVYMCVAGRHLTDAEMEDIRVWPEPLFPDESFLNQK